jgi:two-component system cell cycle sensor histidine kinase/response regulator CckA
MKHPLKDKDRVDSVAKIIRAFFICLFLIVTPSANAANVLLLNSHHQGQKWTDEITRGVYEAFLANKQDLTIFVEYMDATRLNKNDDFDHFTDWLRAKYRNTRLDVIIAADDPAIYYLKQIRDRLFPETPVVFCGANFFLKIDLSGMTGFTGVTEAPDFKATVDLILALHPDTRRIIVINDRSPIGIRLIEELSKTMVTIDDDVSMIRLENLSLSKLIRRVNHLSQGDVILYLTVQMNAKNHDIKPARIVEEISKRSRRPIYSVWEQYLGHGIVGGNLVNGFNQGRAAAQIAKKILAGDRVENNSAIMASPNQYMFDYKEVQRFSIDLDQLPKQSIIINQPHSIYTEYKVVVTIFLIGVCGLHIIIFSLALNILKRRRAEAYILKTQRRFNTIMETAKEGFVEIDFSSVVKDVNPEMCVMIGQPPQKIIGQTIGTFMTAASQQELQNHLKLASSGERCTFEVSIVQPSRQHISCLFNITPIFSAEGHSTSCFAMVSDITELKTTERALQKSEEILRATFESTEDGLLVVAQDGSVTHVNTKFIKMWNIPDTPMHSDKGQQLLDHIKGGLERPEELNTRMGPLQRAPLKALETLRLHNGHILECFSCPLILDNREAGRVWSFRDITEKRELESQLLQAQKMEAIGNLAGGIAHDFNNRLQTISGYTQLLLNDKGRSDTDIKMLSTIERSVRSSSELINQLLMFSRKIESKLTPTDLNHEVRQVQRLLERTIPRMITIQLNLDPKLGIINGDPPQIEQMIMNLGINASHAMPNGGKLTIITENVKINEIFCKQNSDATPGEFVRLRVKDSGLGMTNDIIEHIFEPFFTTKYPGKGTGLGLSMVHGIIKNHKGFITCKSILNQGTGFDLYFPMLPLDPTSMTLHVSSESKMVGGHETILLVEDDRENLDVGKSMLERFGYTVITAKDSNEALFKFSAEKKNIALIILDLNLPGTGGQPILKKILAMVPSAKILIASGFSGLTVKHALAAGASDYIRKPYKMADLLQQVRKIIDKSTK